MKRYSQRSGHTAMAELNVTPLLDLAFVLLIIFIITTPLLTSNIPVELPTASRNDNQPVDPKSIRTVTIDRNGQIYLESKPIDLPVLEQELTAFREATPDAAVVVRADKSLNVQQLFDVMDILQRARIDRMRIENVTP
ncbi:MAG TPA: biopolymer transporter ExbD [Candidatus Methylacidiphilales bacterium]|jgi:biopolymer transport protein ExbD|nr:biopolymer transporter ExbD [Candidatus Methylacidiphilales bacterium]